MSEAMKAASEALAGRPAWLVGGALRDRWLGRSTDDIDLIVEGDVEDAARRLAKGARAAVFPLSEEFGAWRVVSRSGTWHADLAPLHPDGIEADLARRDFTMNAMAEPLGGGDVVDPYGGGADADARRLRMVGPEAFEDDALRVLRLARLACELGLEPEPGTVAAARDRAARLAMVSPERIFAELRRIVIAPDALRGLRLMDDLQATAAVLPELAEMRGVEQNPYHHLDVHEHTLAVLEQVIALENDPEPVLGEHAPAVAQRLAEPLSDELTRGQAMRFGALLHDAAKPLTREQSREGRITFIGHDREGAQLAREALGRLRTSEKLRAHVAALTRHHLRLGFLVPHTPLARSDVYAYLAACEPVEVDVTVLSVADRLATRGRRAEEAIEKHLALARHMLPSALAWRAWRAQAPLVRGDELAAALQIEPGPDLGGLLAEVDAARYACAVSSPEQAVQWARRRRAGGSGEAPAGQ